MLTLTLGSGAHVLVYPKPHHEPASHTVLMFPTDDIVSTVAWARSRGVVFEMLDGVGDDGIMPANEWGPANAWFRDPSGNWLSIVGEPALDARSRQLTTSLEGYERGMAAMVNENSVVSS